MKVNKVEKVDKIKVDKIERTLVSVGELKREAALGLMEIVEKRFGA